MVRLESNGTVLDTYGDEPINLDINVQNNRDIGKVYAPISKTFNLPASDRNNQFFKHYYNVNVEGGFDAYTRTPCQLYVDSEQIFSGYLELVDTITREDQPIQYEVLVTSATPNLSKAIEGLTLDQLEMTDITGAAYNRTQITLSWSGALNSGKIRYGLVGQKILVNSNGSLKATSQSAGDASQPLETTDFFPYMRLGEIVKAIITENGFRYSSTWLDSDTNLENTYLLLGRDGGLLTDFDVLNLRAIDVSGSTAIAPTDPTSTGGGFKQITFPSEIEDPNSDYNTTNSSYTAPANGFYQFQFTCDIIGNTSEIQVVAFDRADITGGCDPLNGLTCTPVNQAYFNNFGVSGVDGRVLNITLNLVAGTEYVFYVRTLNQTGSPSITNRRLTTVQVPYSLEDATLNFSSLLPNIPQKEFLSEVAKAYNLVFVPDKFDDKLIYIEPWVDWIAAGSTFDITEYVDQNKEIAVRPTTELQNRELAFLMGEGESEFDEQYGKRYSKPHGSVTLKDTGNEFAEGKLEVKSNFVASLMQKDESSFVQWPQITDSNYETVDFGLRLGYWSGVESLSYDWLDTTGGVTNYPSGTVGFLPPYSETQPSASDYSLTFSTPTVPSGLDVPLNNWFTYYWKEYIQNIYDKDSRLITLEAKLDAHLLNSIGLNDQILYKNQYYLIQSVKYNTLTNRAQLELLKGVATNPVICGLTPSSYSFRGLVTFTDSSGASTTNATLNCCKFYGFNYSQGKCYTKFDVKPPTGLDNPILNVPADNGLSQVTGILNDDLLVPVLNPTDGTLIYILPSELPVGGTETLQTVTDRGATTTNEIDIPSVQFDTTQTLTPTSGQLGWNADDETLDLGLNGGSVVHKLGETLFFNVKAAEAISKGDVLYASGAVGNSGKIEASKYTANNTIDENRVLGIAAEDISIGDFGFVYFLGSLRGITTDGSDVSETWVDGTILYASPSTAGALTSTQPVAPNQDIPIAFVTSAHATNGSLYIRATQLGYHLGEIHDVYAPSPSDGEVLTWSNANQRWEADAAGGVVSVTPTLNTGDTLIWDGENEQGYNDYTTRQFNYARTGNIANVNLYLIISKDEEMGTGELEADLRFFLPNTMAIRDDGLTPKQPIGTAMVSDGRSFMVMRSGAKQIRFYNIDASGEDPLLANDSFMPSTGTGNGYMLLQATYMAETISGTAPTANFSTSTTGLEVTYTSDAEDAYLWVPSADGTLNTGEDLRAQAITITYPSAGTYDTPTLRVANNFGTDSFQDTITLTGAAPVASFTISDATPNVGQIVTFTDTSTNTPTSWSWAISPSTYVFEGGTSATSQNPQVAFLDESTNYTVNLTATNAGGSDSTAFTNNVVSNALEAVHFEYDPYLYGDADNEGTQVPTTYGSPTYNAAGYYSFDGTDDAFYYDYDNGINDATGAIEVFIDWDDTQNGAVITWGRDDTSSYRGSLILRESDNTIRLFNRRGSSADQIDLKWNFAGTSGKYHIVLNKTASGGSSPDYNYELYVNGVSQGNADTDDSTATTGVWFNDQDNYNPYNITVGGQFVNGVTLPTIEIIGDIYRAAIYEDSLSATRISQNYNWLLER